MNKQVVVFVASLLLIVSGLPNKGLSQQKGKKSLEAIRISTPPKIDGILDDECWQNAEVATDFYQLEPYNGNPASFNSEVKFVYDDQAIYVGAMMYDPNPDSIFTELSERDEISQVDYFGVYIDCFNDYLTAYGFLVTSVGVQVDLKSTESDGEEESWDAVWFSNVQIIENGWVAELKIPYSALRFPKKNVQTWGLQIFRNIKRYRENTTWNFVNRELDGLNNQAGQLHGIRDIDPPLRLSFVPYVSGYLEKSPESKRWGYSYNYGLDLKMGLNESYTLDMTLIPDFGQVQSDDEIYNLSPFEIYYSERRPFFMEGTELFSKGDIFYSRRVGKQPSGYGDLEETLCENEKISENPQFSQLINATKISGKSTKNLAVGFFNAMTANTYATIKDTITGESRKTKTEPFTNYNMLVLDQALGNNNYVSLYNTNVYQPDNKYSANVTGSEFQLVTKNNLWSVWGQGIASQKYNKGISPELGYKWAIETGKISGNFTFELSTEVVDEVYDPNDMGFLRHNNYISNELQLAYNIYKPRGIFLSWYNSFYLENNYLFNPREFANFQMGGRSRAEFTNYLSTWFNFNASPTYIYDYYEPRVDGRYLKRAPYISGSIGFSPDYRKRFLIDWRVGSFTRPMDDEFGYWFSFEPRFRVNDNLMIVYEFEFDGEQGDIGYVTDSLNNLDEDVIIFGKRDIDTWENTLDANYRFTNKSSINLRMRHYWITVNHNNFLELNDDGTLSNSDYHSLHDLGFNAFTVDMAFVWNFAPGSEMRLVWKNSIYTYEEDAMVDAILYKVEKRFAQNLSNTLNSPATNSFSIKLLYYLDYQNIRTAFRKKS
jgi:hypothetical protein